MHAGWRVTARPRRQSGKLAQNSGKQRCEAARFNVRQHAPAAIEELARLASSAKNEMARIGAIRELLDRGYDRPRPATIERECFTLPELGWASDAAKAIRAITVATARGDLMPGEAAELARLVEVYVKALEATEIKRLFPSFLRSADHTGPSHGEART
jgi:hypothetical protein